MTGRQVVVMGVSGCGKTSVGTELAERLSADFIDGDSLHPASNVAKMEAGHPLTDEDRWPWLERVGDALAAAGAAGLVIACSALKRSYRDAIRRRAAGTVFVHLSGSRELLAERLAARKGHFMPATLLDSQLADLEPLGADEAGFAVDVTPPVDAVVAATEAGLRACA